jgi:WD40 repeat protein
MRSTHVCDQDPVSRGGGPPPPKPPAPGRPSSQVPTRNRVSNHFTSLASVCRLLLLAGWILFGGPALQAQPVRTSAPASQPSSQPTSLPALDWTAEARQIGPIAKRIFQLTFVGRQHVAWLAHDDKDDKEMTLVWDCKVVSRGDDIRLFRGPNSNRLAWRVVKGRERWYVLDGKEGPKIPDSHAHDSWEPRFVGPDCGQFVYVDFSGGKGVLYLENQPTEHEPSGRLTDSPDGRHWAFTAGHSTYVVRDGKAMKPHNGGVRYFPHQFSPDGQHFAYIATDDGRSRVWLDEQPLGEVDKQWGAWPFVFSPDSKRLAYFAREEAPRADGKLKLLSYAVVDGQKHPPYPSHGPMFFSADSKHVAYLAYRCPQDDTPVTKLKQKLGGDLKCMVLDGIEGKDYKVVLFPQFHPLGGELCYVAGEIGRVRLVEGDKQGPFYEHAGPLVFSPDGKRSATGVWKDGKAIVVVDGKEQDEFAAPARGDRTSTFYTPFFSPDSRHVLYVASKGDKEVLVVDGRAGPEFAMINWTWVPRPPESEPPAHPGDKSWDRPGPVVPCCFSRDGRRFAYYAFARKDPQSAARVVLDGQAGPEVIYPRYPLFSDDGRHFAYAAIVDKAQTLILDGKACRDWAGLAPESMFFTPQGALAFFASRDGVMYRVALKPPP